ncbi:AAA family ATPase [Nonomuraea dietziae]|uniref:AAA family ATPase n=1 Tax=Nonomuraea dietziae TaxID=65515 RepID=UPI0034377179
MHRRWPPPRVARPASALNAGHGVDAVIGVAGSGKTTMIAAARAAWEGRGLVVAGAATARHRSAR